MVISSTENTQCGVLPLDFDHLDKHRFKTMLHCPRHIKRTVTYSAIFLATALAPAFAADPTGDWRVQDGVANIRVAECNGSMWGVVAWEKISGGHDTNNPDASKQNRLTLGMPILLDMKKTAGLDQWEGQVYNAKDGQTYSSTIRPTAPDQLDIKGCVLGFLCGGETWTRVAPPIPSSPVNSMAKGGPKTTGALPKTGASATASAAPKPTSVNPPATKMAGQKVATSGHPSDPVGDICLLPDIARFAH
jgi:uncharacterized protein (DUF2147 family)